MVRSVTVDAVETVEEADISIKHSGNHQSLNKICTM